MESPSVCGNRTTAAYGIVANELINVHMKDEMTSVIMEMIEQIDAHILMTCDSGGTHAEFPLPSKIPVAPDLDLAEIQILVYSELLQIYGNATDDEQYPGKGFKNVRFRVIDKGTPHERHLFCVDWTRPLLSREELEARRALVTQHTDYSETTPKKKR